MASVNEQIADINEFERRHNEQVERRGTKDVFSIWVALLFIAVIGSHLLLNMAPGSPTGYVTASESPIDNLYALVDAFSVLFVAVLVGGLAYLGISRHDK